MRAGESVYVCVCVCVHGASVCSVAGLGLDSVLESLPLKGPGGWPSLARSFPRAECTLQQDIDFVGGKDRMRKRTDGLMDEGRMVWRRRCRRRQRLLLDCRRRTASLSGSVNHKSNSFTQHVLGLSFAFSFCPSLVFFLGPPAAFGSQHVGNQF